MLVDLELLRPKNESYEHFILKQVGRAWLFKKGLRYIACEVDIGIGEESPHGKKYIADVVGIERRRKQQPAKVALYRKVRELALELGEPLGLVEERWNGYKDWISTYKLRGQKKWQMESSIEGCYREACRTLELHEEAYKRLKNPYEQEFFINTVEAKASISDFRNGYCIAGEYSYIIAPVGIIPIEELPDKVGLLELDIDKFHETRNWEAALVVTKKPKRQYDRCFLNDISDPKSLNNERHEKFCQELIYQISQESTEENIFWNPFLRHIPDGGKTDPDNIWKFKYEAGDVTPLGIVIDRRIGNKPKEELEAEKRAGMWYSSRYTQFYKLVVPNEGITDWISQKNIDNAKVRED